MGLRADEEVRFARGRARTSPGCVVDHRRNDWASHSPHGEFEVVIMIEVVIEEMVGSDRVPDRKDYERAFDWKAQTISESEMALISECRQLCANNVLDRADIVRDGDVTPIDPNFEVATLEASVWRAPCCWDRYVDHVLEGNPTVRVIN